MCCVIPLTGCDTVEIASRYEERYRLLIWYKIFLRSMNYRMVHWLLVLHWWACLFVDILVGFGNGNFIIKFRSNIWISIVSLSRSNFNIYTIILITRYCEQRVMSETIDYSLTHDIMTKSIASLHHIGLLL